jgi:pSer/pThr/pTyr-binding forkhead associated (FHA) protein/V8-like Glu-specific endopeptidase
MLRLVQEFGAHTGRQGTFDQERVRLGRAPDNDVAFDPQLDLDASGHHCEIVREPGGYLLVDHGSRNGTFVNGQRIQQHRLQNGDVIECGRSGPRVRVEIPTLVAPAPFAPAPFAPAPFAPAPFAQEVRSASEGSAGAAIAAQLPSGAQVGKRTVALMIDQALAQQSGATKRTGTGLKVALLCTVVLLLAGLGGGGYVLWDQHESNEELREQVSGGGEGAGERISQQNEGAIYLLAAVVSGRTRGFCTGFAVTTDLIATNAHCVDAAQEHVGRGAALVALRNNGRGEQIAVQPVFRDPRFQNTGMGLDGSGFDVGLMRTNAPLPVQVRLASVADAMALRPGAQIYVYGFPGLTMNEVSPVATITQGVVNRSTDFFDRAADPPLAQKVQHSAQTTSGSSGSPIFLANGSVIGVNAGSLADEERQRMVDPRTGQLVNVEVNRSSNFKYGMRADLIRSAVQSVGQFVP